MTKWPGGIRVSDGRSMTSLTIAETLGRTGLCVCANFLSSHKLKMVRGDLDKQRGADLFRRAGSGQFTAKLNSDLVRRDEILWLDRELAEGENTAQAFLWRRIDRLKQVLNRSLFLNLSDFQGHYAVYSAGGFYKRHLDRFRGDSSRTVSFVLYLNHDWQAKDGGRLRVFDAQDDSSTDIDPIGGTMVCFLSGESEHEVLPSHQDRFSFSGWFTVASPALP